MDMGVRITSETRVVHVPGAAAHGRGGLMPSPGNSAEAQGTGLFLMETALRVEAPHSGGIAVQPELGKAGPGGGIPEPGLPSILCSRSRASPPPLHQRRVG
jgi:hypothetical protein